jgi:hypothetical protein
MNQEERDWLEWLKRAQDGVVTQRQAAKKMGVSDRWVRKLLVRMKTDGDGVVVHGLRGRMSNRQIDEQTQARAIELLKQPGSTARTGELVQHQPIAPSGRRIRRLRRRAVLRKRFMTESLGRSWSVSRARDSRFVEWSVALAPSHRTGGRKFRECLPLVTLPNYPHRDRTSGRGRSVLATRRG